MTGPPETARPVEGLFGVGLFGVALVEPEIPANTGNIGRTCVAMGCTLHLVHPLGFEVSAKVCRRAGLDYWPRLQVVEHADWDDFDASTDPARRWVLSTRAARPLYEAPIRRGDVFVLGKESAGLPARVVASAGDRAVCLPMLPGERSINLAVAAGIAVGEGLRQLLARGEVCLDASGRVIDVPPQGPRKKAVPDRTRRHRSL